MRFALSFASLLCVSTLPAQIIANINDSRSHGTVGDALLSLDEAIQLANGTLAIAGLSNQERAQLSGVSGVVGPMRIDAAVTPVITMQRLLSNIVGQHHSHVHLELTGISGPSGPPVLDGNSQPVTLPVRMNDAHIENFIIRGGQVGIEFDTTLHYHPSEYTELGELHLEGQSAAGIRVRNPRTLTNAQAPLRLHDVHIHGAPIGLEVIDDSVNGNVDVSGEHVEIDCTIGVKVAIDSTGNDHVLELLRSTIVATDDGVVIERRSATSTSRWRVRFVHGSCRAFGNAFDIVGSANAATGIELHHLDVRGGVGATSHALRAGPQNAGLSLLATECTFYAPVEVAFGTANSALRLFNNRCEAGELSLSLTAGSADVQWCNFTAFPIEVEPASSSLASPIAFTGCELVRSSIGDRSIGRTTLTATFLGGSSVTPNVQNVQPQLAPWIGRASVSPRDPPVGTFVDLLVDLHPGTAALWLLSTVIENPITTATPLRFYLDLPAAIVLPGVHVLYSRARLPIPNVRSLRGASFYFQPVQLPTQAQPLVPPLFLPLGGAITIE